MPPFFSTLKILWNISGFPVNIPFFPMKPFLALAPLLALILTACGHAPSSSAKGGVALIDLDAVAKRLGRDVSIVQEIKNAANPLGEQLTAAQKEARGKFESLRQSIGAKPTDADNQKLAELERELNLELQQKQQQAQQELNAKQATLINRFREEVRPVAMKIAADKGLGAVLLKSDALVLGNEPALDITDDVVAELTRTGGAPAQPL